MNSSKVTDKKRRQNKYFVRHLNGLSNNNQESIKNNDSSIKSHSSYDDWNKYFDPFHSAPNKPWHRPTTKDEEFTVVTPTFKRLQVLRQFLKRMNQVPHINSIVVLWNEPKALPVVNDTWPDVHVPVHIVAMDKNSLNNRFLPLDVIQTDAVLSLDDDVTLSQEEIQLGFNVWKENRER